MTGLKRKEKVIQMVIVEIYDSARTYMEEFPDVAKALPHVLSAAIDVFPNSQIQVYLYEDYENRDEYLLVNVRTHNYKDILKKLEEVEKTLFEHMSDAVGWIQLSTDFKEPELRYDRK